MATYSTDKGFTIQVLSADPSNPVEGQVWFNTSSGTLKSYNGSSTVTFTSS